MKPQQNPISSVCAVNNVDNDTSSWETWSGCHACN